MIDMKRLFVLLIVAMSVCALPAQIIEEGESALVYYSPKTAVHLDFTYTVQKQERGIFAPYAESLLGIRDAVQENSITYTLDAVRIGTTTRTDYSRPHKVPASSGIPMLLHINEKGLLTGYNTALEETPVAPNKKNHKPACEKAQISATPYPEEVIRASGVEAQAHAAAQQIYHLRETRMYLINGEVENAPADGKAMQLVLEELDKQEKQLVDLFVGKRSSSVEHKQVELMPKQEEEYLFFSEENGFTDAENIDADTIKVQMALYPQQAKPAAPVLKKDKKQPVVEMSPIVYNLPGHSDVSVTFRAQEMAKRTIPVAQLGIDVPLTKELFTGAELPQIVFSEKTGNIVSISK